MEPHERLRKAREAANFATAADAARRFGWNLSTYRAHENGQNDIPQQKAEDYARSFRVSPEWILWGMGEASRKPVPLVGYVGAGAEVFPAEDSGELEEIEPPPGVGPDAVAVKVKGDSMFPRYSEGDILFYERHISPRSADGREVVVALTDGRIFVKNLFWQGDGLVTLVSWNAPPIRDVEVNWVALIKWVQRADLPVLATHR